MNPPTESHKGHRVTKTGRGAKEAKKLKADKKTGNVKERKNNRAFSVANIGR